MASIPMLSKPAPSLSFVIKRGDRMGVRAKDSASPVLRISKA